MVGGANDVSYSGLHELIYRLLKMEIGLTMRCRCFKRLVLERLIGVNLERTFLAVYSQRDDTRIVE